MVRQDLKLPKGKVASQAAHASVEAVSRCDDKILEKWRGEGMAKIVLKVADENELIRHFQEAKDSGIAASLITDAGRTVVEPGTRTAAAIGPASEEEIDNITGNLKML